jgi:hypothetical protein
VALQPAAEADLLLCYSTADQYFHQTMEHRITIHAPRTAVKTLPCRTSQLHNMPFKLQSFLAVPTVSHPMTMHHSAAAAGDCPISDVHRIRLSPGSYGRIFKAVEKVPAIVGPSFRLCIEINAPVDASN